MTATAPVALGELDLSTQDFRQLIAAVFGATPFTAATVGVPAVGNGGWGVIGDSFTVTGAGSSVSVAKGLAVVAGSQDTSQHGYVVGNDAPVALTSIPATSGASLRRDLVCAQVRDGEQAGETNNDMVVARTQGTASTTPVDPTPPASSLPLARLRVNNTGVYLIDDLRPIATAQGGTVRCTVATRPTWAWPNLRIIDETGEYLWTGSSWLLVGIVDSDQAIDWSPTLVQSITISPLAVNIAEAVYTRQGAVVDVWVNLSLTGSGGAAGFQLEMSLPVPCGHATAAVIGDGIIYKADTSTLYNVAALYYHPSGRVVFSCDVSQNVSWGATPSAGFFSGDILRLHLRYLAA